MAWLGENKFFKDRARRMFSWVPIPKIESSQREVIYAGIQVTGGAFLAAYTNDNPEYRFLPLVFSAIAVGGTCNALRIMRENSRKQVFFKKKRNWTLWDLATGIAAYSTGVYAFSEALKHNDRVWIPCLALAASGYYFTGSYINSMVLFFHKTVFRKCCQLLFEPALVACAATYLHHFQNQKEGWLKCLPFLVTAANGYKTMSRGISRDGSRDLRLLLLKSIEMFIGGCIFSISCAVLAFYSSANDFYWPWTAFTTIASLYGDFIVFGSLLCLRLFLDMDRRIFLCTVGVTVGPIAFSSAYLITECVEENDTLNLAFLFLTGIGQIMLFSSVYQLYQVSPLPAFYTYCDMVFGPVLAVYSSAITAYVWYRMGWRLSLVPMAFIPAGIYAFYRSYKKPEITPEP